MITNKTLSRFQRLQVALADIIDNTPAGGKLKSEPELAAELGVSRATLREAMRSFEGQGLIRRRQGVGTFVLDHKQKFETGLEKLESIETQAKRMGLEVEMGYLGINHVSCDEELAKRMHIPTRTSVVRISRVIRVSGFPAAYLVDNVLEGILKPEDINDGFSGSVLDLFIRRKEPVLSHSETLITACPAPAEIAKPLNVQRSDVLLKLEAYLFDEDQRMIDYSESFYIPGFFSLRVNREIGE